MRRPLPALLALLLAQCATPPPPVATMPAQPAHILLSDFAVDPDAVRLDEAAPPRRGAPAIGDTSEEFRRVDAETAQEMVTTTLAYRLHEMGFEIRRFRPTTPIVPGDVLIGGRIDRIDEGAGAGRAAVTGQVQALLSAADGSTSEIASFKASSDANRPPGLPGATAAEAAALRIGGVRARQLRRAAVSAEARRLANSFADQISAIFARRNLLPAQLRGS